MDWNVKQIAAHIGTSVAPVVKVLKKYQLRKPSWLKSLSYELSQKVLDKEYFISVVDECISMRAVEIKLGVGQTMVTQLYKYHNIPRSTTGDSRSRLIRKEHALLEATKDNFIELYVNQRKSLELVCQTFAISMGYLTKFIRDEWNIQHLIRTGCQTNSSLELLEAYNQPYLVQQMLDSRLTVSEISSQLKCYYETTIKLIKKHRLSYQPDTFSSSAEREITHYIQYLDPTLDVRCNDRKVINPFELDIYIPDKNIAIEYCGLYWHSDAIKKDKNYHLKKHNLCKSRGIQLLTIFEDEWIKNPKICKSKIDSQLGISNRIKINARDCVIKEIDNETKKDFLNTNHIQGNDLSKVKIGLYKNDMLIAAMTFSKPSRARNSAKSLQVEGLWELNRYATSLEYHVRGGAGKLLSHFKTNWNWSEIYSYADIRWSDGQMYQTLGFSHVHDTNPNYWYIPPGYTKREYRFKYTKASLVKSGYDPTLTEEVIMRQQGFKRIWDCGVMKFSIKNPV